ncbi:MAG TPA: hypothetical protein VK157_05355 [Phycisphaerales bacterium]|nr:hypothetical protein [Phycisphaerales bacterium]
MALFQLDPRREIRVLANSGPLARAAFEQCPHVADAMWSREAFDRGYSDDELAAKIPEILAEHQTTMVSDVLAPRLVLWREKAYVRVPHLWRFSQPEVFSHVHVGAMWWGGTSADFAFAGSQTSIFFSSDQWWQSEWRSIGDIPAHGSPWLESLTLALTRATFGGRVDTTTSRAFIDVASTSVLQVENDAHPITFSFVPQKDGSQGTFIALEWPEDIFDAVLTLHDLRTSPPTLTELIASRPYDKLEETTSAYQYNRRYDDLSYYPIREIQNIPIDKLKGEVRWIQDPRSQRQ